MRIPLLFPALLLAAALPLAAAPVPAPPDIPALAKAFAKTLNLSATVSCTMQAPAAEDGHFVCAATTVVGGQDTATTLFTQPVSFFCKADVGCWIPPACGSPVGTR